MISSHAQKDVYYAMGMLIIHLQRYMNIVGERIKKHSFALSTSNQDMRRETAHLTSIDFDAKKGKRRIIGGTKHLTHISYEND